MEFQVQLLQIHTRQIAHLHVFQVMPTTLIPGTQVRCVSWQRLHVDRLRCAARQVYTERPPAMNTEAIPTNEQSLAGSPSNMLQKHPAVHTSQRFLASQRVNLRSCIKTGAV